MKEKTLVSLCALLGAVALAFGIVFLFLGVYR
jgi:hypothetical protein